jgi:hypothetical protein
MSRLFLTHKEFDFMSDITKEAIKDLAGHAIYFFPVSYTKSSKDDLYNESEHKVIESPLYIECLIDLEGQTKTKTSNFGHDEIRSLKAHIHKRDMDERNIVPKIGDYVQYGNTNYEVTKVSSSSKRIYGYSEERYEYELTCEQTRDTVFLAPEKYPATNMNHARKNGYFTQIRGEQEGDERALLNRDGGPVNGIRSSPYDDDTTV